MHKVVLILFLSSISLGLTAQDLKWLIYPNLGIDVGGAIPLPLSVVPSDMKNSPKLNPLLGMGFEYNLHPKWNLALEINYHIVEFSSSVFVMSQSINHGSMYFSGDTKTDVELRQVEFPLLSRWKAGKNWSLIFGAYYSRIIEGSFVSEGTNGVLSDDKEITDNPDNLPGPTNVTFSYDLYLEDHDYGVLLGYRYDLSNRLFFWGRLHMGFNSIFVDDFEVIEYEMYQIRLSVGGSYALFHDKKSSNPD